MLENKTNRGEVEVLEFNHGLLQFQENRYCSDFKGLYRCRFVQNPTEDSDSDPQALQNLPDSLLLHAKSEVHSEQLQ